MDCLLIAGFGDIARRAAPALQTRFKLLPLGFDLDGPGTIAIERAEALLHCVPPPGHGYTDPRTANLLAALEKARILPARIVYVSTSAVYGDCNGARVRESRPPAPQTERGRRRLDAERQLERWAIERGVDLVILRTPGIYAADRLPLERLRAGLPALRPQDDVYTNHIHADDLAAIICRALERDARTGVYNACDDSELKMGDWFDLVADARGLPRPPRVSRQEAAMRLSPEVFSFMCESRRLDNGRLKHGLGIGLRYPTVYEGLKNEFAAGIHQPA